MSAADIGLAAIGWLVAVCFALCAVAVTVALVRDVWRDVVGKR